MKYLDREIFRISCASWELENLGFVEKLTYFHSQGPEVQQKLEKWTRSLIGISY